MSEEHNPENVKRVSGVEVFLPSDLLSDGMCLVDTPGLGSVFSGNTAATQAFVPHIDAAIVVVGADPPIAGEELALVEEVGRQISRLVVVLNKADRTSEAERRIAIPFTQNVIAKRLGRPIGSIFEISYGDRAHLDSPSVAAGNSTCGSVAPLPISRNCGGGDGTFCPEGISATGAF